MRSGRTLRSHLQQRHPGLDGPVVPPEASTPPGTRWQAEQQTLLKRPETTARTVAGRPRVPSGKHKRKREFDSSSPDSADTVDDFQNRDERAAPRGPPDQGMQCLAEVAPPSPSVSCGRPSQDEVPPSGPSVSSSTPIDSLAARSPSFVRVRDLSGCTVGSPPATHQRKKPLPRRRDEQARALHSVVGILSLGHIPGTTAAWISSDDAPLAAVAVGVRDGQRLRGHRPLQPTVAAVPLRRRKPMPPDHGPRERDQPDRQVLLLATKVGRIAPSLARYSDLRYRKQDWRKSTDEDSSKETLLPSASTEPSRRDVRKQ